MKENQNVDVQGAFEILLEEIEGQISLVNREAAADIERRDYGKVESHIKAAQKFTAIHEKVIELKDECVGERDAVKFLSCARFS
jgi:hypothetical protein